MSTLSLVNELKQHQQDHEFYPTTNAIIRALVNDLQSLDSIRRLRHPDSVLDVGAGNGKVLLALKEQAGFSTLLAIEKSSLLCRQMPDDILIVGTEFAEQSLLSKPVDVLFSNPPYSQFETWAEKILRQAAAKLVYLVIPVRWEHSAVIQSAIAFREAEVTHVGQFDFENAEDRQARAQVHLLRIELPHGQDDAFERFFQEQFAELIHRFETKEPQAQEEKPARPFHALVVGPNYPEALVNLYQQEMANIQRNYQLVNQLDVELLRELEVKPPKIMECLKARLNGLRHEYWHELFSHLSTVTDRLTAKSRKQLLATLHRHVQVDFTLNNIFEIVIWVIKNANRYIDRQLLETYELMVDKCNVHLYRSNHRVWVEERWRYQGEEKNSHYYLDYRIVTHRLGGIRTGYSFDRGLEESAAEFLGDLLTLAHNLGFNCPTVDHRLTRNERDTWTSGKSHCFYFTNQRGQTETLFDVRAFKNRNLHLRLHKSFIVALNVEHGRLRGWLRSAREAVEELRETQAAQYFHANVQLCPHNPTLLLN